jgi:hypothetical protein
MPFGLFLMGLIGGATHCITMCGPFVISQGGDLKKLSDIALVPYHTGRIITYVGLTIVLYSMVNIMAFYAPVKTIFIAPLLFLAGLLFIVNATPRFNVIFPWIRQITLPIPYKWTQKLFSKTQNRFVMGLILGFMPCGLVLGAMMIASSASSMTQAALSIVAFGVGTIPALILTAMGGQKLKEKFPKHAPAIRAGFMIWSGLWLFAVAGMMVMRG